MRAGHTFFSLRGVPVRVHPSLVALAALLGLLALVEGGSPGEIAGRLLAPLLLFLTVIVHEFAHAVAAQRLGVRVADIVLTPFGGVARLEGEVRDGRVEALVAGAGPAANLALATLLFLVLVATGEAGAISFRQVFLLDTRAEVFYDASPVHAAFAFNVLLGTLNLIPAFPMDGGRILRGLMALQRGRLEATRLATRLGLWFALAFLFAPMFLEGRHWWVMPVIGVYLIFSGLKERLVVEAREGILGGAGGTSGGRPRVRIFGLGPPRSRAGGDEDRRPDAPPSPGDVIDVSGHSRRLDERPDEGSE
ncbi:MAG: M50 family metallopeptidase [Planctomycetota bacterium]